jgi:hypothetical protein
MSNYLLSACLLLALGGGLFFYTAMDVLLEAVIIRFSRRPHLMQSLSGSSEPAHRANLRQIEFPTITAYLICFTLALIVFLFLGDSPFRFAAFFALLIPFGIRQTLEWNRNAEITREVRAFLMDMRQELASRNTLLTALQALSETGPRLLSRQLRGYLSGYTGSGLVILQWLAEDTQDEFLRDLSARTSAALSGGLGMDEAIQQTLSRAIEESNTRLSEELQRSPARLTLISIPLLLGPIFVLWVIPMGSKVLASFAGY